MKIITAYPIIYKNNVINRGGSNFSNITGSSTSGDITLFQNWYNKQAPKTALVVDGKWGPKTKSAWKEKGAAYEKQMLGVAAESHNIMAGLFGGGAMPPAKLPENISVSSPSGEKKKGMFWDKLKGGFVAAKEAGILDAGKNLAVGAINDKAKPAQKAAPSSDVGSSKENIGGGRTLSTTAKILIGGGALLIITLIIIKVSQPKKA